MIKVIIEFIKLGFSNNFLLNKLTEKIHENSIKFFTEREL